MAQVQLDWLSLSPLEGRVMLIEMRDKAGFSVDRDQPLFEMMYETSLVEAARAQTQVSICVDARRVNFVNALNVVPMLSRFRALVNKLHAYNFDGRAVDLVTPHLGCTAIVIESSLVRQLVNGIISVLPTKRPVRFFDNLDEALQFSRQSVIDISPEIVIAIPPADAMSARLVPDACDAVPLASLVVTAGDVEAGVPK